MDNGWKILIGITVIFFVGINALILVAGMNYPDGFDTAGITITSVYRYDVTLTGTETAENVTLMIPLPIAAGDTPIGDAIVRGNAKGIPADWTVGEVGTEDFILLKVTAPSLSFTNGPVTFGAVVPATSLIDTADPAGETFLLRPKENISYENGVMHYTTPIYAKYTLPGEAGMEITVHLDGSNTWRYPINSGNRFTDVLILKEDNRGDGWQTADGTLTTAIGKYSLI